MPNCSGYIVIAKIQSKWYDEVQKNLAVFKERNKAEAFVARLNTSSPANILYEIMPIRIEE